MEFTKHRMAREAKTIAAMIRIYCQEKHNQETGLCQDCSELLAYANKRLEHCPFQEKKSTCGKCRIHCYKPAMREKIKKIMAHVGPKMMRHHPLMGLAHLLDGLRKAPELSKKRQRRD